MSDVGFVTGGWLLTAVGLAAYAGWLARRITRAETRLTRLERR